MATDPILPGALPPVSDEDIDGELEFVVDAGGRVRRISAERLAALVADLRELGALAAANDASGVPFIPPGEEPEPITVQVAIEALINTLAEVAAFRPPLAELDDVDLETVAPAPGDTLVFEDGVWRPGSTTSNVPAGVSAMWNDDTPPDGWFEENGALVSRAAYPELFAAIGTRFGAGDGSTTFALPDSRGEFIRGWDNGRGVDVGRALGSSQADELKSHNHIYQRSVAGFAASGGSGNASIDTGTTNTGSTGGGETRPKNVTKMVIIKF